jgi:hypothetical protein
MVKTEKFGGLHSPPIWHQDTSLSKQCARKDANGKGCDQVEKFKQRATFQLKYTRSINMVANPESISNIAV